LYLQNPPNAGTVQAIGTLGVTLVGDSGFDILSTGGGNNAAVAALQVGGTTGLYGIDLTSGGATLIGPISGNPTLLGLTVSPMAINGTPAGMSPANLPVDSRRALLLLAFGVIAIAAMARRRASAR
jgi:hypothetical protein